MSCYHPLKAFPIGLTLNGKTDYKICSYNVDHLDWRDRWYCMTSKDTLPMSTKHVTECIEIPCGKCLGCKLDYSRMWADRCMLEAQYYDHSYFVTLTYDNVHVPRSQYIDDRTGELCDALTLRKSDFQKFMKRLRKKYGQVRYYACGEYGGKSMRPHYHAILFGLNLDDLVLYKSSDGMTYYNSPSLSTVWKDGFVVISEVTWATCAYTARYVVKKAKSKNKLDYSKFNIQPEFVVMSRRPGIGYQYFEDHDCYDYDYINISTPDGGKKIRCPRYFDKLLERSDPERYQELKDKKVQSAKDRTLLKLAQTDNGYLDMLEVSERVKESKIKSLSRARLDD